jgi:hypothetical protein
VLKRKLKMMQTIPMIIIVANRAKMITDQYRALKLSIQGHELEKDMRVLDVQSYNMILRLD